MAHHHQHHSHNDESIAKNAEHFDAKNAQQYDNDMTFKMGQIISNHILKFEHEQLKPLHSSENATEPGSDLESDSDSDAVVNPFWKSTRVLDFACGTGIISQVCAGLNIAHICLTLSNVNILSRIWLLMLNRLWV